MVDEVNTLYLHRVIDLNFSVLFFEPQIKDRRQLLSWTLILLRCLTLLTFHTLLFGKQDWVKTEFQTKVLALIHFITENRNSCASCPVHYQHPSVTFKRHSKYLILLYHRPHHHRWTYLLCVYPTHFRHILAKCKMEC